jgi:pimeloyl-ACP methyl ester carboxylesterase
MDIKNDRNQNPGLLKAWLKRLGFYTIWGKLVTFVLALFIVLLILNQYFIPQPSQFSARPTNALKGVILMPINTDGLDADFFYGISANPKRAIVLLGGSEGGRSWSYRQDFIQELINHGFCVLSLPYFGTDSLPGNLRDIPLEYFQKAFHWLSSQKNIVIADNFALVGVSRGAELALLLGARYPEIKAVIAIAPSSVVFPGPPTGIFDAIGKQHSAWSLGGLEVPFVHVPYSWTTVKGMFSGRRTQMFEDALPDSLQVNIAAIPVEKINGNVLLVSFKRDQVWPSTLMCGQIVKRLHDKHFDYYYEHADYDGTHSDWSITACHKKIISFLNDRF